MNHGLKGHELAELLFYMCLSDCKAVSTQMPGVGIEPSHLAVKASMYISRLTKNTLCHRDHLLLAISSEFDSSHIALLVFTPGTICIIARGIAYTTVVRTYGLRRCLTPTLFLIPKQLLNTFHGYKCKYGIQKLQLISPT